jgi:glycosyltransferase involved in cell wall biosynthesis
MSRILWATWKDHKHPGAGGAEVVARELTLRLARDGHEVTILTCGYPGAAATETEDGINFVRVGSNRYLHPFQAMLHYAKNLRGRFDVVIEEIQGCAPYFISFLESKNRYILYHQLARLNWLYEVPKPFSYVGYWLVAPAATRLASLSKAPVITVSESTKGVLARYGFAPDRTRLISEGLHFDPLRSLEGITKYERPTLLSFGAMRAMKRTIDQVKAFEIAKRSIPQLQLKIGGSTSGSYGQKVRDYVAKSPHKDDIEILGKVSVEAKAELMQKSHLILVTSVEEGWGLIVSEANGQGTPAVVYDVSGLRDSVRNGDTGVVTDANPAALAAGAVKLLGDPATYERLRRNAWQWSQELTFDKSYADFKQIVGLPA